MIKKQVIIDIQFGTSYQEKMHMGTLLPFLEVWKGYVERDEGDYKMLRHKLNKCNYKIK